MGAGPFKGNFMEAGPFEETLARNMSLLHYFKLLIMGH
jgi:hypothetical protein